ncbi:hypothetical protein SDC9_178949 [bioreactor metagenome]|uniref:DUF4162 domain-containing protein n=1 Tax=bioreactor metagenome TaxID=1076179 RepID=A0A645GXE7_9ZZZZ
MLKKQISGDSVIQASIHPAKADQILSHLSVLGSQNKIELKNTSEPQVLCIQTPEPARVLELLSPYLHPESILSLEVRNQTLEDVYVTIIQGETE